jgi:hypothetical protein
MKKPDGKFSDYIIVCGFFLFLIMAALLTIFLPKKTFSEIENRSLAVFPRINFSTIENKKAMDGIENYISDHFPLRTDFVKINTDINVAIGQREINDVYIGKDRLSQKITTSDMNIINGNIDGINAFSARYNLPVFVGLIPTSAGIYPEDMPANAPNLNQQNFIKSVYENLDKNVTNIDVYSVLRDARDEYIYYRTDHHWTTAGAFIAYKNFGEKMGFSPLDMSFFEIEKAADDFRGSLYSKVLYDKITPDSIDIYHENFVTENVKIYTTVDAVPEQKNDIYFREYLSLKNKYNVFLGENVPLVTIDTNSNGKKLLIIKDSYANSFVPFLLPHYSSITLLDMRYINVPLDEFIDVSDFDQALVLYNVYSFNTDGNLLKLF